MCLISYAPAGTNKYSEDFIEALRNGAVNNTDGIGFAFKRAKTGQVFISKGYNKIEKVLSILRTKRLTRADELIVHQRIGNRGALGTDMCHPFVLADNATDILVNKVFTDKPVMAHNGTFFDYNNNTVYSDTFQFIQSFMYHESIINLLKTDIDFFKKTFKDKLKSNRLAFLFPNENQEGVLIGEWIENKGYYYSNEGYRNRNLRNVGGSESILGWGGEDGCAHWPQGYPNRESRMDQRRREEEFAQRQIDALKGISNVEDDDEDEDDELNFSKPVEVNSSSIRPIFSSNGTIINSHATDRDREPLNSRVGVSTSTHKKGYRRYNSMEIPVSHVSHDPEFKRNYIPYGEEMGMCFPFNFQEVTQFETMQLKPTIYNYTDILLRGLKTDPDYDVKEGMMYVIQHFPKDEKYMVLTKFFHKPGEEVKFIVIPTPYFYEFYSSTYIPKYKEKYEQYYELVRNLPAVARNLMKVRHYLGKTIGDTDKFFIYSDKVAVSREVLNLYKYLAVEKLYEKEVVDKMIMNTCMF